MKEYGPPGDLIYQRDGYEIYEVDGEDEKVNEWWLVLSSPRCIVILGSYGRNVIRFVIAVLSKPLPLRQVVPRDEVGLL